jgi:subtilisin family serine protease
MAAPHVAGAAALYLADHPTATPAQVQDALVAAGTKDVVTDPADSPNVLLYTGP